MSGGVDTIVTYLEMVDRPETVHFMPPPGRLAIMRAVDIPAHFYRYLYRTIGRDYNWSIRWALNDAEIGRLVGADGVEVYVLYVNGVPSGMAELDFADARDVQILYFGLMPHALGQGYGRYFFQQVLEIIWDRGPERVRLNTCTLDHPRALPMYQRFGFEPYAQEEIVLPAIEQD